MENEKPNVQTKLPLELYKAFRHKLTDERRYAKEVLRELVELWVKGDIVLPKKSVKPTRRKKT
jgi:hypothetical protein